MAIYLLRVVIERQNGPQFCGILFYIHEQAPRYLPWSVDLQNPRQVVLKLYPPEAVENLEVCQEHCEQMADVIVDAVFEIATQ